MANVKSLQALDVLTVQLNKVGRDALVVINFWADWAEPSKHINEVVDELAKQHSNVLFIKVEAENAPEISEKFEIEAVPTTLFLQAGKVVDRINGANAAQLTQKVSVLAKVLPATPPVPAASSKAPETQTRELTGSLKSRIQALLSSAKCLAFIKGTPEQPRCGFTRQLVELFARNEIDYTSFNILEDEDVRQGLKIYSDWPTFPQVYVSGDLVGGLDIIKEMEANGELKSVLPVKTTKSLTTRLKELINQAPVMLFMKGTPSEPRCGFSSKIVQILKQSNCQFDSFDILEDEEVRSGLKTYSNWPTFPQLYVNGELIGGLDIVKEMQENGELATLLVSAAR